MSEFLSRLGGAVPDDLKSGPLDRILNHLTGGQAGTAGLQALIGRLRGAGLGEQVESWIGTGENRPVQPGELERALPGGEADRLAQEAGMTRPALLALLSQVLPKLVDAMTPDGQTPQGVGSSIHAVPGEPEVPGVALGMGAAGAMPSGSPAAAPYGGAGGDTLRHAGQGAGGEAGMPHLGPAEVENTTAPASGALGPKAAGPQRER